MNNIKSNLPQNYNQKTEIVKQNEKGDGNVKEWYIKCEFKKSERKKME